VHQAPAYTCLPACQTCGPPDRHRRYRRLISDAQHNTGSTPLPLPQRQVPQRHQHSKESDAGGLQQVNVWTNNEHAYHTRQGICSHPTHKHTKRVHPQTSIHQQAPSGMSTRLKLAKPNSLHSAVCPVQCSSWLLHTQGSVVNTQYTTWVNALTHSTWCLNYAQHPRSILDHAGV
jgi:hypothetical protein